MNDRILLAFIVGLILGAALAVTKIQHYWENIAVRYGIAERDAETGQIFLLAPAPEYSTRFFPIPSPPEHRIAGFSENECLCRRDVN